MSSEPSTHARAAPTSVSCLKRTAKIGSGAGGSSSSRSSSSKCIASTTSAGQSSQFAVPPSTDLCLHSHTSGRAAGPWIATPARSTTMPPFVGIAETDADEQRFTVVAAGMANISRKNEAARFACTILPGGGADVAPTPEKARDSSAGSTASSRATCITPGSRDLELRRRSFRLDLFKSSPTDEVLVVPPQAKRRRLTGKQPPPTPWQRSGGRSSVPPQEAHLADSGVFGSGSASSSGRRRGRPRLRTAVC